jgi:phosphorylase kinase alpha/beta subunit
LDADRTSFFELMEQIASGEVAGIPVKHGRMAQLTATAAIERIDELHDLTLPDEPLASLLSQPKLLAVTGKHLPLTPNEELAIDLQSNENVLVQQLVHADNLYLQIALLAALAKKRDIDTAITLGDENHSIRELLEEVYSQAGRLRLWTILRNVSGLLNKVDSHLSLAVSAMLVAQKYIQVGLSYTGDSLISKPLNDEELMAKIHNYCREDVRDKILTQEVLLCLGVLIRARPKLFSELLTIRVSHLIILLTSQLARDQHTTPDQAYESLMDMPPSVIKNRLEAVLEEYQALVDLPQKLEQLHAQDSSGKLEWQQDLGLEQLTTPKEGWLVWRQHQGTIDRRTELFNGQIWHILHHTPALVIGNKMDKRNRINSDSVLSDMTKGEASFALLVAHMLNNIQAAEYRQLTIETLSALASFFQQNPTLMIDEAIVVDVTIGHAVNLAYLEQHPHRDENYSEFKSHAWESFYARSPLETTVFLICALRKLLTLRAPEMITAQQEYGGVIG